MLFLARDDNNKRRKVSSSNYDGNDNVVLQLSDELLVKVASFLPEVSRVLFATAMTAPPASCSRDGRSATAPQSGVSMAILSSMSAGEIDFNLDTDTALAEKLSEGDIQAMLLCIDATIGLRKVAFASSQCHLTGRCLEPLRGSTVIECLDLKGASGMLEEIVVPIMTSILEAQRGDPERYLKNLKEWRRSSNFPEQDFPAGTALGMFKYIQDAVVNHPQFNICYQCLQPGDAADYSERCLRCNLLFCGDCENMCEGTNCDSCHSAYCEDCSRRDDVDAAYRQCSEHNCCDEYCTKCRVSGLEVHCDGCKVHAYDLFVAAMRQRNGEISQLRQQLEESQNQSSCLIM